MREGAVLESAECFVGFLLLNPSAQMIWGSLLGTVQNIIGGRCNDVGPYTPPIQTASLGKGETRGKVRELESVGQCQPLYIAWRGNRLRGVLFSSGPFKCHPRKYPSERVAQRKTGWLFCFAGGPGKKEETNNSLLLWRKPGAFLNRKNRCAWNLLSMSSSLPSCKSAPELRGEKTTGQSALV